MARVQKKMHAAEPQDQPDIPAFPAQWLYGLYAISPVTMLGCHRRPQDAGNVFPNLTPASERQDHATSPYAAASFVCALIAPVAAASIASRFLRP
jgi:hypothetical protein